MELGGGARRAGVSSRTYPGREQQVAAVLGLSQVKVSREEKKIMTFLRGELA